MNRTTRIAAIALSLAAAGSAFADDITVVAAQPTSSSLTRAAVQAEYLHARAAGELRLTEVDLHRADIVASTRSRADVRAETLAAIASGELHALNSDTDGFTVNLPRAKRASVDVQMARAGR